ncbi:MAG: type II secretion system protein [Azonexaceae bacterium]|nr:type II secretion system protein [Azonexaceae bacterium]
MTASPTNASLKPQSGFSLVELTIVLVIVALLAGGLMFGLSGQREQMQNKEARQQLETIREALIGYAMTNGRLPCPAPANLPNSDPAAGKARTPPCTDASRFGVVPWVTLGLAETDPWGNRFTYFVSSKFTAALAADAQASFTISTGSATAVPADNSGTANVRDNGLDIASDVPAVIVSHGSRSAGAFLPNGAQLPGAAGDEAENADSEANINPTFIAHTPTDNFDDLVTWIIPTVLKSRMVAVGKLP